MCRVELLKKQYINEYFLELNEGSPIRGEVIYIQKYGDVSIENQTRFDTAISYNSEIKTFHSEEKCFFDYPSANKLRDILHDINIQLENNPGPIDFVKRLIERMAAWDRHGDFYINELIPQLMENPEEGTEQEAQAIRDLRNTLNDNDWNRLPDIVREFRQTGAVELQFDPAINDARRQADIEIEAFKQRCKEETVSILEELIRQEAEQERLSEAISSLNEYFDSNYLSSRSFRNNPASAIVSNEDFENAKCEFIRNWFSTRTNPVPDDDQLNAIGALEKNVLVVARAGSGKTSTIVNRARFLIEHCHVDPSNILMLAFNRKAAEEMRSRLAAINPDAPTENAKSPHAMTFHALAYSVVNPAGELIFNDDDTNNETLDCLIQYIIDDKLRNDTVFANRIKRLMRAHFRGAWEAIEHGGFNLTQDDMLRYRRNLSYTSLRGESVRAYEVKLIANILFEHNVSYTYRESRPINNGRRAMFDFVIYRNGAKPVIIDYVDGDNDNRDEHFPDYVNNRAEYYQFTGEDLLRGEQSVTDKIKGILDNNDIPYQQLSDDEIWARIRDRAIDSFTEAVRTFIGRCRKNCLSPDKLRNMIFDYSSDDNIENEFLILARDIYRSYVQRLTDDNLDDFDGLMHKAIDKVSNGHDSFKDNGKFSALTHILIDEYQDFSMLFDRFIYAIKQRCPSASLFCVGDDWQAINGFAGSDVRYFQDFVEKHDDSREYRIRTNYRSPQKIVSLGTSLMSRNDEDNIQASTPRPGMIKVGYLNECPRTITDRYYRHDRETVALLRLINYQLNENKQIAVLSRVTDGIPEKLRTLRDELMLPPDQRHHFPNWELNNSFSHEDLDLTTVHKYKGKEKETVIITDAIARRFPLIHPNWIFQRIFGDTVTKLVESERRLFYVALTRAADELIILTNRNEKSPFLEDINLFNLEDVEKINWSEYPAFAPYPLNARIEVSSEFDNNPMPTVEISGSLRDSGYRFYQHSRKWCKLCEAEDINLENLFSEPWIQRANGVVITILVNEEQTDRYIIREGVVQAY